MRGHTSLLAIPYDLDDSTVLCPFPRNSPLPRSSKDYSIFCMPPPPPTPSTLDPTRLFECWVKKSIVYLLLCTSHKRKRCRVSHTRMHVLRGNKMWHEYQRLLPLPWPSLSCCAAVRKQFLIHDTVVVVDVLVAT